MRFRMGGAVGLAAGPLFFCCAGKPIAGVFDLRFLTRRAGAIPQGSEHGSPGARETLSARTTAAGFLRYCRRRHARRKRPSRGVGETKERPLATSVHQFLCLTDNYGVLVHDSATGATASIDAPEAGPILAALSEKGWTLTHLLITHHHADHVQGTPELKARFPDAEGRRPGKGGGADRIPRCAGRRGRHGPGRLARSQSHRDAGPYARPGELSLRRRRARLHRRHAVFAGLRARLRSALRGLVEFAGQAQGPARRDEGLLRARIHRKPTRASR